MSAPSSGNLRQDGTFTAAGKGQVCIPTKDKNLQFRKIKAIAANQVCFDCPTPRPTWASVTYGTCFSRDCVVCLFGKTDLSMDSIRFESITSYALRVECMLCYLCVVRLRVHVWEIPFFAVGSSLRLVNAMLYKSNRMILFISIVVNL